MVIFGQQRELSRWGTIIVSSSTNYTFYQIQNLVKSVHFLPNFCKKCTLFNQILNFVKSVIGRWTHYKPNNFIPFFFEKLVTKLQYKFFSRIVAAIVLFFSSKNIYAAFVLLKVLEFLVEKFSQ